MRIDFLERHLAIGSREEAERLTLQDKKFWNVISICSPTTSPPLLRGARRLHAMRFEDTEDMRDIEAVCVPNAESIKVALEFVSETMPGPLLVHCQMGWSRSTAVALVLLVQKLWPAPDAFDRACAALLEVRPRSRPNVLIAKLGFGIYMPEQEASLLSQRVAVHPQFVANRLNTSHRQSFD